MDNTLYQQYLQRLQAMKIAGEPAEESVFSAFYDHFYHEHHRPGGHMPYLDQWAVESFIAAHHADS